MTVFAAMLEEPPRSTPTRLTGRQKLVLSLADANYSHAEIAEKMGIKHRQAASRLIARARAARQAIREAAENYFDLD